MITSTFKYRSHRGVIEERTIDVDSVEWVSNPGYDYQPGWFISGMCHDRNKRRSFVLTNIVLENRNTSGSPLIFFRLFQVKETFERYLK